MGQHRPLLRAKEALAVPLLIAAVIVFLDQIAKWFVTRSLGPDAEDHRAAILGANIAVQYVENSGAAFGLLRGQSFLLTIVALAVVVALVVSYRRARNPSWQLVWGLGLLLGGALGNLIDRIRLGYVVDFVAISIWPKFNFADSAITVGVLLIAWHAIAYDHLEPNRFSISQVPSVAPDRDS